MAGKMDRQPPRRLEAERIPSVQVWLDRGLQPRAVTRDLDWGVPVPLPDSKGKVLYVWFDAPIGYISATKALFRQRGDANGWEKYWKSERRAARAFHRQRTTSFSIASSSRPCCTRMVVMYCRRTFPANEFLNLEGDKISTSRNWAVWLHEYLQDFPANRTCCATRFCATAPETKDNDFTWKRFRARNNSELVAIPATS